MGRKKMFASSDRAQRELGFRVVPVARRCRRHRVVPRSTATLRRHDQGRHHRRPGRRAGAPRAGLAARIARRRRSLAPAPRGRRVDRGLRRDRRGCGGARLCRDRTGRGRRSHLSVGWAGALRASLRPAGPTACPGSSTRAPGSVSNPPPPSGDLLARDQSPGGRPAGEAAPRRRDYGAALVDMEAAGVARLAAARGIPFSASRGSATARQTGCPTSTRSSRPAEGSRRPDSSSLPSFGRGFGPRWLAWEGTGVRRPGASARPCAKFLSSGTGL
jgi:hypothetical protein